MSVPSSRTVRVFLSSTFRDFGEERDLLVRRVFPGLRARLKDRFVELVDVDLRWGITVEQAERGEVVPICLAEIDRARPFFVGMLGERYGWIPPADAYALDLLERQAWLEDHRGGRSVTELEILHGVLNDPRMAGRAYFYFRAFDYAQAKGGDYVAASEEDAARQADLKTRIRASGFPVLEDYPTPEAFADRLEEDLWAVLDASFPADEVPDAFEHENRRHEAYAAPRQRLYLGGGRYVSALTGFLEAGDQRVLIEGPSGGGKSALIANWLEVYRKAHPGQAVFEHYTGASADAAAPVPLVRRLIETIKRTVGSSEEIPGDPDKLLESLSLWLAYASAWASKEDTRWVIVIDALNGLSDLRDLRWLPEFLPANIQLVVSCLPGEVLDALVPKGEWSRLTVEPLSEAERHDLLVSYLSRYNKTLPEELAAKALSHPLAANPLFLRTLAEELRVFGVHEQLQERLGHYLKSVTVDDLFERVLERVEGDCGATAVKDALEGIWASRAGLSEAEILGIANLLPATWAPIRYALDEALLESNGRLTFAHDYLRLAVAGRYLGGDADKAEGEPSEASTNLRRQAHAKIAEWFERRVEETGAADARAAEEIPHQWREARDWARLKASLTGLVMFRAIVEHHSAQELLSYWLDLERESEADIETDYEAAWATWALDEEAEPTGELAFSLQKWISYAGRYKSFSMRLARLSVDIAEKVLGSEHPDTGTRLNNLADLLRDMGDYAAAVPLFRRALAIAEKAQGPEHRQTGTSLNNLGDLLRDMGDYAAAEPLLRRALAITEKNVGPTSEATRHRPACQNNEPDFDALIEQALGCYVYVLRDPLEGGRVFYVGKGGGTGAGNDRVLAHFQEAKRALVLEPKQISAKVQRIHAIWSAGQRVDWEILRYGLPNSDSAFDVEAALIDYFGRDKLANAQRGHGTSGSGRLVSQDVYRLAAPMVEPCRDYGLVLLFNVEKAIKANSRSPYDATRGWWIGTKLWEHATHAVGLVRGVSVCVVEIERWLSRECDSKKRGFTVMPDDYDGTDDWEKGKRRRGFEGTCFTASGSHELLDKNYKAVLEKAAGYWGFGNWLGVKFSSGTPIILRGVTVSKLNSKGS